MSSRVMVRADGAGCMAAMAIAVVFIVVVCINPLFGMHHWGPKRTFNATVSRTWVDHSKDASHYMVATDAGVFEVDNGWLLDVWSADVLFGRFQEGKTYTITTKGNRVTNFMFQQYPYVTEVVERK